MVESSRSCELPAAQAASELVSIQYDAYTAIVAIGIEIDFRLDASLRRLSHHLANSSHGSGVTDVDNSVNSPNDDSSPSSTAEGVEYESEGSISASDRLESTFKALSTLVDDEFDTSVFFHEGDDYVMLENLRQQLAVIPEFDEDTGPVDLGDAKIGTPGVVTSEMTAEMRTTLDPHVGIFQGGGNALPPPVRGVVCDIDVGDALPIADRARRIPQEHLVKVYELLKKLLDAGLIRFSDSPWASPIVIVMKKNGSDIRLCIDYRRVNQLIKLMNYPLPLIDDLLENFDKIM